jgi:hypothetical protein
VLNRIQPSFLCLTLIIFTLIQSFNVLKIFWFRLVFSLTFTTIFDFKKYFSVISFPFVSLKGSKAGKIIFKVVLRKGETFVLCKKTCKAFDQLKSFKSYFSYLFIYSQKRNPPNNKLLLKKFQLSREKLIWVFWLFLDAVMII